MEVTLSLKHWKVAQDDKTKMPIIQGSYSLMMGEKEIAVQGFNDGYHSKELPFSGDTMAAILKVEAVIKDEIQKLLS